jgi:UPF0271 protein
LRVFVTLRIDLNADVGEGGIGHDAGLMKSITSASIAAGFHAGDPSLLRRTIRLAKESGVAVGAHPGFADRDGFGRREIGLTPEEAEDLVLYQIAAVAGVAAAEGVRLQHVKPHGALYNMAARDRQLAAAVARAISASDSSLILFAPPRSELFNAGRDAGLRVAAEVFADRAYEADGSLAPRQNLRAVIDDAAIVVSRAIHMVRDRSIRAVDGTELRLDADTICVHSDTPGADAIARKLRDALEAAAIVVKPVGAV